MTHNVSARRTTPRLAQWRQHCAKAADILCGSLPPQDQKDYPAAVIAYGRWYDTTDPTTAGVLRAEADEQFSDPLADAATAMAILHFAVEHRWLPADELASVRAYFADTPARELAERILANVHAGQPPLHLAG